MPLLNPLPDDLGTEVVCGGRHLNCHNDFVPTPARVAGKDMKGKRWEGDMTMMEFSVFYCPCRVRHPARPIAAVKCGTVGRSEETGTGSEQPRKVKDDLALIEPKEGNTAAFIVAAQELRKEVINLAKVDHIKVIHRGKNLALLKSFCK